MQQTNKPNEQPYDAFLRPVYLLLRPDDVYQSAVVL